MADEDVDVIDNQGNPPADPPADPPKDDNPPADPPKDPPKVKDEPKPEPKKDDPPASFWNDEWRQKIAEHASAGNKKAYDKEMKRLERFTDPAALYGQYREAEAKLTSGTLTKVPGKDATDEEIAAFHKSLGVPEKAEDLVTNLELPDGVTLGKQDQALAGEFAADMHSSGLNQAQMNKAMSWYFKNQEAQAAHVDELDDQNRIAGEKALKEEYGGSFKRNMNAMGELFTFAPGGNDLKNEDALINRLLAGRMADGTIIGDDPDMTRFLVSLAKEVNPVSTVVDDPGGSGKGIEDEIKEIEGLMRSDRRAYNADERKQARYRELLEAREKMGSR